MTEPSPRAAPAYAPAVVVPIQGCTGAEDEERRRQRIAAALPNYEVGKLMGKGAWGFVFEGRHRHLGREVAIKELPESFGEDEEIRRRFVGEAQVLAALDHPHVVPVYDYVERDGLCLLVMEKLSGATVWSRFSTQGMSMQAACATILATCAGLQSAHERRILHRDIKPDNLLFADDGTVKIADFGIASVLGGDKTLATRAGEVLGTPAYMAPEQARGEAVSAATDVYAAGVMLYELLSGRRPFEEDEDDPLTLLFKHAYEDPPPLDDVAADVPSELAAVTMRALAKDPARRYPSAEAFGTAVSEAATAAWGAGWMMHVTLPVMASNSVTASVNAESPAPPSPTVRPDPSRHPARTLTPGELSLSELVPVEQVVPGPPSAALLWLLAAALLLASVAIAFTSLGERDHGGDLPDGTVTIGGVDPATAGSVELDVSEKFTVAGRLPPAAVDAVALEVSFNAAGIPLGRGQAVLETNAGRTFSARIDATVERFVLAGDATAELAFVDEEGATLASQEFALDPQHDGRLTFTFLGALVLAGVAFSSAEASLGGLFRGRRHVSRMAGIAVLGIPMGTAITVIAWGLRDTEPTFATLLATNVVASGTALLAGWSALQSGRRRRAQRAAARARRLVAVIAQR